MKRSVKFFFTVCTIGIIAFPTQKLLFPFVYRLKEPSFVMPIAIDSKTLSPGELPLRNDQHGQGAFGAKRKGGRKHAGLDLAAKMKSPVYASKSGWARTRYIPDGYGNLIIIDHPGKWQTRYGHLAEFAIKKFQWVRQGDIIGFIGKTGNARFEGIKPHLHFEIIQDGKPVNPQVELTKVLAKK